MKFTRLFSWRAFEADYVLAQHHYPKFFPAANRPTLHGVRLRTGFVFSLGYPVSTPVGASVTVQPTEVMVGEPLTANATASNFNPKHTLTYDWSSTCGNFTGKAETASIDTNGAAGGNCTVSKQTLPLVLL